MKRILLIVCLIPTFGFSQIPERPNKYDSLGNRLGEWVVMFDSAYDNIVESVEEAHYYCLVNLVDGRPKGKTECFYINGVKQWDGGLLSLEPEIKHGEAIFYYPLGNIQIKTHYVNDVQNGPYEEYYEDGQLAYKGTMKSDSLEGTWELYHPNGQLSGKGNFSRGLREGYWEFYHDNGNLQSKGNFTNDKNDGFWEFYNSNGQLRSKGTITNGLYQGKWTFYYSNGQVEWETTYVDDLEEGMHLGYYENGNFSNKGTYSKGKKNGFYQYFFENGQVQEEGQIVDDLYQGPWIFYYETGEKSSERHYVDDLENGYCTYFHKNGKIKAEGETKDNHWHGNITFYSEEGNITAKGPMVYGLYHGDWTFYYPNGQIQSITPYKGDTINGYREFFDERGNLLEKGVLTGSDHKEGYWEFYYPNGQLKTKGIYKNNFGNGYFESYLEDGRLQKKGEYIEGKENGYFEYYFDNGNLKSRGSFDLGKKIGFWQYYHDNGKLSTEGQYENGNSIGHWKYYYDNGNLRKEGEEFGDERMGIWKYYHRNGNLNYMGETRDDKGEGLWVYFDSLGNKTSEGYWENNVEHGKWTYYKNGKKDYVDNWHRGTLLNFQNLGDSARNLADLQDRKAATKIRNQARRQWRKEYDRNDAGYHGYLVLKGDIIRKLGDYDKGISLHLEALEEVKRIEGDTSWNYQLLLNDIGLTYSDQESYPEAVEMFARSLAVIDTYPEKDKDRNIVLVHLAKATINSGEHNKGLGLLTEELENLFAKDSVPEELVIYTMKALGDASYNIDRPEEALTYYNRLINYMDETGVDEDFDYPHVLRFMAYSLEKLTLYDSAAIFYHKAIAKHRELNDTLYTGFLFNLQELGDYYYGIDLYDSAEYFFDLGKRKCEDQNYTHFKVYFDFVLGRAKVLLSTYRYQESIELCEYALKELQHASFDGRDLMGEAYWGLSICQKEVYPDDLDIARDSYQKAISIFRDEENYNGNYVHSMLLYGQFLKGSRDYENAKKQYNHVLRYLEKFNQTGGLYEARALRYLGNVAYSEYNYELAREYFQASLDIYEQLESSPSDIAWVLSYIADTYEDQENYDEGGKYLLRALNSFEKAYGKDHIDYAGLLAQLGYHNRVIGKYQNAIVFYKQSIEIKEKVIGKYNQSYLRTLNALGVTYRINKQYDEALQVFKEIENLLLAFSDKYNENYLDMLQASADTYDFMENLPEAEKRFKEMIAISQRVYGASHEDHAYYLREIGRFYKGNGKIEKALHYLIPAANIVKKAHGERNQKYAYYAELLGDIYYYLENYRQAESIRKLIVEVQLEVMGRNSWDYMEARWNLARLYDALGRYVEAEEIYEDLLALTEENYGKFSYTHTDVLREFGQMYRWWGRPDLAKERLQQSVQYLDSIESVREQDYFSAFSMLGLVYSDINQIDSAYYYLTKCRDGAMRIWGKENFDYFTYSNNLAFVYLMQDNHEMAEKLYLEGAKRFEYKTTVTDLELVNYEDNMAALYLAWGKLDLAEQYWLSVTEKLLKKINTDFAYMSESEKANFWDSHKANFEYFNSYALAAGNEKPKAIGQMYDNQLQIKSILLSTSTKERRRIMNSGDSVLTARYFEYVDIKERLAKYYGYTDEQLQQEAIDLDSLETLANDYEKQLSLNAENLRKEERAKKIRWRDIQRNLKENEAAVEMIRFRYFDKQVTDSVIYAALILTSETRRSPELVILPNGKELENKYFKSYRASINFRTEDPYSYSNFWQVIDEKLNGKTLVYFSPDAVYNQINVNTFRRPDGSYVLDHYNVQVLTSTRDILLLEKETKKAMDLNVAALFGFPTYDLAHSSIENIVIERAIERSRTLERDIDLARFGFTELPGTKTETETIEQILSRNQWEAELYLGTEALEEILKEVNNPRVLHIATHGFFLDDVSDKKQLQLGVRAGQSRKDPLLRSGLLLAGAAQTVKGEYENRTENGIFTAYEAMNLDLNNTDLVVLSACETGRGEVKSGEGVYGLQRAFQVAGTESLIMSLWKVNDEATQQLMTHFYENWLTGMPKNKAFEQAQLSVREEFDHPYFWGAFVMVGN